MSLCSKIKKLLCDSNVDQIKTKSEFAPQDLRATCDQRYMSEAEAINPSQDINLDCYSKSDTDFIKSLGFKFENEPFNGLIGFLHYTRDNIKITMHNGKIWKISKKLFGGEINFHGSYKVKHTYRQIKRTIEILESLS